MTQLNLAEISKGRIFLRPFRTEHERLGNEYKGAMQWGRFVPDSVLVAAIGNHWAQGAWQCIADMVKRTGDEGLYVGYTELQDRCFQPYDALGTMRNEAMLIASNEGFEWVLMVDNDVHPEADALLRLIKWQVPIIVPFVAEPGTGRQLHGPAQQPGTGLKRVKWAVLSMLLLHINVMHCVGPNFWRDATGADEGIHFQHLWWYGHALHMDTDVQVVTGGRPTYPLGANSLPPEEREKWFKHKRQSMSQLPDRRPVRPDEGKGTPEVYWPFGGAAPETNIQPERGFPQVFKP